MPIGGGAFPYVFQHFKVVGQSIPFFIIFTAKWEAVAEMSAYLSAAAGGNKTQARAHIRLSCRCFPGGV